MSNARPQKADQGPSRQVLGALALVFAIGAVVGGLLKTNQQPISVEALNHDTQIIETITSPLNTENPEEELIRGPPELMARLKSMLDWMGQNGFKPNASAVLLSFIDTNYGFGLVAQRDYEELEKVFCIPDQLIWTSANPHVDPNLAPAMEFAQSMTEQKLGDFFKSSLALAFDLANPNSYWRPMLDVLPAPCSPMTFNDEELDAIQNPNLLISLDHYFKDVLKAWRELGPDLKQRFPQLTDEFFVFSLGQFSQRAFAVNNTYALAPYMDMFNSKLIWDPLRHHYKQIQNFNYSRTDGMCLFAQEQYKAGDQLFGTYQSKHTTAEWFLQYGFVVEDLLTDYVVFTVNVPRLSNEVWANNPWTHKAIIRVEDVAVPELFLRTVIVSLMTTDEFAAVAGNETALMSQENIDQAFKWMAESIFLWLKPFGTSKRDQTTLKSATKNNLSYNMINAIRFRIQFKKKLEFMFERLRSHKKVLSRYSAARTIDPAFPLANIEVIRALD